MASALVVGAGPAGIAAAGILADAGATVTLVDEAAEPGGQIYCRPAPGLRLDLKRLLGAHIDDYEAFHAKAARVCERVDYRPATLAWNVRDGAASLLCDERLDSVAYDCVVLATGATDRIMPVAGWTLPGVFTLGGAQALLKGQGCLIGRRTVFCGSSPLLYLAALQYVRMGGIVEAVVDTTPFGAKLAALPRMTAAPKTFLQGLGYMRRLRRHGVWLLHGATVTGFAGGERVDAVLVTGADGARHTIACDSVAYGHGLRPESQLAEIAGCAMRYDALRRLHLPESRADGRLFAGHYVCGDGGRIGGAEAAGLSGALAGAAAALELGLDAPILETARLRRRLAALLRFQDGLATAFAWPHAMAAGLGDEVTLCRCEEVTVGAVRASVSRDFGGGEVNRVKAATRCGMGRCQGRFCGHAAAEVTAAALGQSGAPLGRLRAQPPVKPLPIAAARPAP